MYGWIWRRLPGGFPGKLLGSALLVVVAVAVLFVYVFPWVEPRLPFNDVTVDQESSEQGTREGRGHLGRGVPERTAAE